MDQRLFFPATERNRDHIGEVLSKVLPQSGLVLEIASGSGEHGVAFQKRFPNLCWQTSDPALSSRESIRAWINYQGLGNKMPEPIDLDAEKRPWLLTAESQSSLQAIVCINMIHISPWSCTEALFEEAGNLLKKDQLLMLYGPFKRYGDHISESNSRFDKSLKVQNPSWGVRDLDAVSEIGMNNGLEKYKVVDMPANNLSIIFLKKKS